MRRVAPAVCLIAVLLAAPPTEGGVIRGTLQLPATPAPHAATDHYPGRAGSMPVVETVQHGRPVDAVISVDPFPGSGAAARGAPPGLAQKGQNFVPRVLAITAGTTVAFPNFDPVFHNVFSVSPARRFDLGKYPRGQSRSVRFDRPGIVQVYCDIHANMAAWIVVASHGGFTRPDVEGAFRLPALPPGEYVVSVWHPDLPAFRHKVRVPAQGDVLVELEPTQFRARAVAAAGEDGR